MKLQNLWVQFVPEQQLFFQEIVDDDQNCALLQLISLHIIRSGTSNAHQQFIAPIRLKYNIIINIGVYTHLIPLFSLSSKNESLI